MSEDQRVMAMIGPFGDVTATGLLPATGLLSKAADGRLILTQDYPFHTGFSDQAEAVAVLEAEFGELCEVHGDRLATEREPVERFNPDLLFEELTAIDRIGQEAMLEQGWVVEASRDERRGVIWRYTLRGIWAQVRAEGPEMTSIEEWRRQRADEEKRT